MVEDHDLARAQRGHQILLDGREKGRVIERALEDRRRVEAIDPQGGDNGARLAVATRRVVTQPQPPRTGGIAPQQIGRDAGFVEHHVAAGIVDRQGVLPLARAAATSARRWSSANPVF